MTKNHFVDISFLESKKLENYRRVLTRIEMCTRLKFKKKKKRSIVPSTSFLYKLHNSHSYIEIKLVLGVFLMAISIASLAMILMINS